MGKTEFWVKVLDKKKIICMDFLPFIYLLCAIGSVPCSGKASASREEDPGFESRLPRDFFRVESYQ